MKIRFILIGKPDQIVKETAFIAALEQLGKGWLVKYIPTITCLN